MKRLLLCIALSLLATAAQAQTVVLVRHAEKAAPDGDPVLSSAGVARAAALAEALSGSRLTHVLVTATLRTQQTAAPAASARSIAPEIVSFDGGASAHVARVAARVRALPPEAVVLVVGHSNTVPLIAAALGQATPAAMSDCEYDRLTVITLRPEGEAPAIVSHYGSPSGCE